MRRLSSGAIVARRRDRLAKKKARSPFWGDRAINLAMTYSRGT